MTILIISEKPSAARKIASALSNGKAKTKGAGKVKYHEFELDGQTVQVAASVGHVYGIRSTQKGNDYPVFDIQWSPSHEIEKNASYTKDYLNVMRQLAKTADEVVNACDYDFEGELIGAKIIEFNAPKKKKTRMKFSTLTAKELQNAFQARGPPNTGLAQAGETRHELDWLWGINGSRALMAAIKKAGIFRILSIGRVQGPALAVLAQREREISAFISKPFWQLFAHVEKATFEHVHGKFFEEKKADEALAQSDKNGTVTSVEQRKVKQRPPPPFDLTSLQLEAYRCFGFTPTQTLQLAQDLYSEAWISYPRTSSQKLPETLGLDAIIFSLTKQAAYQKSAQSLVDAKRFAPAEGPKEDPAHPAIHPTGEAPFKLNPQQQKLYDLITKRFLSCFAEEAKRIKMHVVLTLGKEDFQADGAHTVHSGWHSIYAPYTKIEETILPPFKEGQKVTAEDLAKVRKDTQPPKRFTQASVIKALESKGLGTKATRAQIVQTLYNRNYVSGKSIEVTPLGLRVQEALEHHVPEILSEEFTRQIEAEMEAIEAGKTEKEKVVEDGKKELTKILSTFKKKELDVGKELVSALKATQFQANVLGECKKCGKNLVVRKSRFGFFVGCLGYPACKTVYPLPKESSVKALRKTCEKCGTPQVSVHRKSKKTFSMCLDPQCETKANWGKPKPPSAAEKTSTA
ncbi:DNA topoisomerase I [Candidatus Micrarchaeota archaeon]|nr:DNA topoisomerase I [Candidatus Micrarchaeota archaeon]